jgi:outer membrane receptor protein involved in Fe transport
VGTDVHYAPYRVKLRLPEIPAARTQVATRTAYDPLTEIDASEVHLRPAAYAELVATPSPRFRFIGGVRMDYYRDIERVDFSPRLSARYDLLRDPERTTLKAGVGLFAQPPLPEVVLPGFGTPELRSSRAVQSSLGVEQTLGSHVEASVEGFVYQLSHLVRRNVTASGELEFENSGEGTTLGLESMLRIKPASRFYGWLAYTLSRSVRRQTPDDPLLLAPTDSTHVLTALGSYRLGRGWEAGMKFQYVSGNPYTPTTGAIYSSTTNEYLPVLGDANSERLPAYHELDVRVQKRWSLGGSASFTTYVDLINVYGKDRVVGIRCSDDVTRCDYSTHPMPMIPSVGIRGEF